MKFLIHVKDFNYRNRISDTVNVIFIYSELQGRELEYEREVLSIRPEPWNAEAGAKSGG